MSKDFKVQLVARSINSKRLLKEIKTMAEEVCNEYIVPPNPAYGEHIYDFDELVRFIELYFDDLCEKKRITQYDVMADHRNNSDEDVRLGTINMSIKFRQTNCINVSKIDMKFIAS